MSDPGGGKRTAFVSHYDCARHDTGWGHPDHQGRLPGLMRHVYRDMLTLFEPLLEVEGGHASREDLLLAHEAGYLDRVREWSVTAGAQGRPMTVEGDLVVSDATWEASLAAVGCVLTAIREVLESRVRNAFCAIRPPGQDAARDRPGRFGALNAVSVGARHLLEREGCARLLVVGWGGGGLDLADMDPARVRTVEMPLRPAAGGADDGESSPTLPEAWVASHAGALAAGTDGFEPDFILLSAGFDGVATDPVWPGPLQPADFHGATAAIREFAEEVCGGRLVSALAGGYDPNALGASAVQHLRALAGLEPA
jgi:acetoin utilization deacetylase AcuC-like enzyme